MRFHGASVNLIFRLRPIPNARPSLHRFSQSLRIVIQHFEQTPYTKFHPNCLINAGKGKGKGKGKSIPLQAFTGPEGSRRLRLPDFKTIGT
jgi:hypothetical protein